MHYKRTNLSDTTQGTFANFRYVSCSRDMLTWPASPMQVAPLSDTDYQRPHTRSRKTCHTRVETAHAPVDSVHTPVENVRNRVDSRRTHAETVQLASCRMSRPVTCCRLRSRCLNFSVPSKSRRPRSEHACTSSFGSGTILSPATNET